MNTSGSTKGQNIVSRILADIAGRRGLRDVWDSLDNDTTDEIIETWDDIVRNELARLAPEPAARLEYQPGSLTEEEIAGGADIPNCLRCGRTLFGGHSHDSRWYCSSETKVVP